MVQSRAAHAVFPSPQTLDESIVWTVAYSDQFQFPLTAREIFERCVRVANAPTPTFAEVSERLTALVKKKKLACVAGYFFLPGRSALVTERKKRQVASRKKERSLDRLKNIVRWIPWIESVWITGSLAVENATVRQDVDFMIITAPNRLWLSRFFLTALIWVVGKKRAPGGGERGTWCFNLWLDSAHVAMPKDRQNLYTAYEVLQARPFVAQPKNVDRFWRKNAWVNRFLWTWSPETAAVRHADFFQPPRAVLSALLPLFFFRKTVFNMFERLFFYSQMIYMRKHRTTEEVSAGVAFFHPRQTSVLVSARWRSRIMKDSKDA